MSTPALSRISCNYGGNRITTVTGQRRRQPCAPDSLFSRQFYEYGGGGAILFSAFRRKMPHRQSVSTDSRGAAQCIAMPPHRWRKRFRGGFTQSGARLQRAAKKSRTLAQCLQRLPCRQNGVTVCRRHVEVFRYFSKARAQGKRNAGYQAQSLTDTSPGNCAN